jgi:NADPH-dependent glutamate synthase beta subunit-like oxidoreductase
MGVVTHFSTYVDSLKNILAKGYDAVFVGTGAPRGRDLDIPGRQEAAANIHIGIDWLASVAFGHIEKIGRRVVVLGGGNTAMDCCRTSMRLGGDSVSVVVRSPRSEMKASPWEIEDAEREGIPMFENHVPVEFAHDNGRLTGIKFEKVRAVYDSSGKRSLVPTGEDHVLFECDDVLIAVGQENAFPWIERDVGVDFGKWDMPAVDEATFQSSNPKVFFGGDAAFGPKNVITAVAQGHQAAVSMDLFLRGEDVRKRPAPGVTLISQKMGVHEWSYDNKIEDDKRYKVPHAEVKVSLTDRKLEVELGFNVETAIKEAQRCLNCDVQTVFTTSRCIECDACADICPTECISFVQNEDESALRKTLRAPATNLAQDLYVSTVLPTERVLVKDENVCLHCGLCAERCPTGAWDMQKFLYQVSKAGCVS